jgi:hypothetical protein
VLAGTWVGRRFVRMDITRTIRMLARPMGTTVQVSSRTGSSSAQGLGTTAGDIPITDVLMVAALTDGLRAAGLRGVALMDVIFMGVVLRGGVASKDVGRAEDSADAANESS